MVMWSTHGSMNHAAVWCHSGDIMQQPYHVTYWSVVPGTNYYSFTYPERMEGSAGVAVILGIKWKWNFSNMRTLYSTADLTILATLTQNIIDLYQQWVLIVQLSCRIYWQLPLAAETTLHHQVLSAFIYNATWCLLCSNSSLAPRMFSFQ